MSDLCDESARGILRHFLAALAYRTRSALEGAASDSFGDFQAGQGVRTPHELLNHMNILLGYAKSRLDGGEFTRVMLADFESEIAEFHERVVLLAQCIETCTDLKLDTAKRLLQGPLCDAMTHTGQLAMLRRLWGTSVPPENFFSADMSGQIPGADETQR
jgi:hypothetical protein